MLNERRRDTLAALIQEYVASAHPVSSRMLVERCGLTCSPATVRNDLAALEGEGLLFQPHVSAGRIPTDSGYRTYVDRLGPFVPSLAAEVAADLRRKLATPEREMDELVRRAAGHLAQITPYAAVVMAPAVRRSTIRRLSLVPMGPREVLVVVVTDLGQVLKRLLELPEPAGDQEIVDVERYLSEAVTGRGPTQVAAVRHELLRDPTPFRRLAVALLDTASACLSDSEAELVAHGGLSRLLTMPEFSDARTAGPLLSMLEDARVALARLAEMSIPGDTFVRIGHENDAELASLSIVATAWGPESRTGLVCLIGPTRMHYPEAMATTSCVAEGLSEAL